MSESKTIWIGAAIIGILLLLPQQVGAAVSSLFNGLSEWFDSTTIALTYGAYQALLSAGLTSVQAKLGLSQVMFETGAFESTADLATGYNNYSGIMWINSPAVQLNAYQGPQMPGSTYYYAGFNTVNDWAVDYVRIVNLPPYTPIASATTPAGFALLLSENGYYTASESSYAAGLQHYWNIFTDIGL